MQGNTIATGCPVQSAIADKKSRDQRGFFSTTSNYSIAFNKRAISDGFFVVLIPQASMMSSFA